MNRSNDISQGTVCQVFMLLRYVVAQNSLANKFNKKAFSRMHTARLPTISCCIPFPGVRVGMHSPGHTHPEVPCLEEDRYPRHIHSPPEGTWYERYPPIPRKDMGPEIPTPNPRGQPDTCEKHYLPATSFAGGKNLQTSGKLCVKSC